AHPEVQTLAFVHPLDTLDLGAELEAQAFAPQHGLDDGGGVLVLAAEDLRQDVEGDDLRSQAAKGLRELAADRPGADDGEAAWLLRQREHGLVRQVAGRLETFDRRRGGARAGGDHRFGEAQHRAPDFDRLGAREPTLTEKYVDSQGAEALQRIV